MTVRDIGLAAVRMAPWVEGVGRWVYVRLPAFLHDTPASRLRAHFAGETRVTFVQIGAYDGMAGDPIRPLVIENDGWSGVMVEPQPDAFERLQRNYLAQASRLQFVNAAVSDETGDRTFFSIPRAERERLGLPDWSSEMASFDPEHLLRDFPNARLAARAVPTLTFAEVADRLPAGQVDVVIIDTEGHERVIVDTVDLNRHRVRFIMYEHKHLSADDCSAVESRLKAHAFSLKKFGRDTIACRALLPTILSSE